MSFRGDAERIEPGIQKPLAEGGRVASGFRIALTRVRTDNNYLSEINTR